MVNRGGDVYDLVTIGEALIDFLSTDSVTSLVDAEGFERHLGGSPANIAVTIVRLGGHAALATCVGDDAFGHYVRRELAKEKVGTEFLTTARQAHTSLVFVARTAGTPDFIPVRDADLRLGDDPGWTERVLSDILTRTRAVHVSTWPLTAPPARDFALAAVRRARERGLQTSLDPNYSRRVWPDRDDAVRTLQRALAWVDIVKPSLDDAERLFGARLAPERVVERFHDMGAGVVILTMGREGVLVSDGDGALHIPARPIAVADATGAGDAFWAGYLMARLDGLPTRHAAYAAREFAEMKLRTVGTLPAVDHRERVYESVASYL